MSAPFYAPKLELLESTLKTAGISSTGYTGIARVPATKGAQCIVALECWCAPKRCHADVIAKILKVRLES